MCDKEPRLRRTLQPVGESLEHRGQNRVLLVASLHEPLTGRLKRGDTRRGSDGPDDRRQLAVLKHTQRRHRAGTCTADSNGYHQRGGGGGGIGGGRFVQTHKQPAQTCTMRSTIKVVPHTPVSVSSPILLRSLSASMHTRDTSDDVPPGPHSDDDPRQPMLLSTYRSRQRHPHTDRENCKKIARTQRRPSKAIPSGCVTAKTIPVLYHPWIMDVWHDGRHPQARTTRTTVPVVSSPLAPTGDVPLSPPQPARTRG